MNNACIIAACAVNSRNQKKAHNMYAHYFDKDFEIYYHINFRMYLHFRPITVVAPTGETFYIGSYYAPVLMNEIKPITLEAQSIAKQHTFSLKASKCKNGPDKYIEEHIDDFTSSQIWGYAKEEIISMYLDKVNKKYNIDLDKSSLDYTTQYCWEVECDVC